MVRNMACDVTRLYSEAPENKSSSSDSLAPLTLPSIHQQRRVVEDAHKQDKYMPGDCRKRRRPAIPAESQNIARMEQPNQRSRLIE
jgi:hypothetical protein